MNYILLLLNELTRKCSSFSLSLKFPQAPWTLTPPFLKSLHLISFAANPGQASFGIPPWSSSSVTKVAEECYNRVPFESALHCRDSPCWLVNVDF